VFGLKLGRSHPFERNCRTTFITSSFIISNKFERKKVPNPSGPGALFLLREWTILSSFSEWDEFLSFSWTNDKKLF